jgi:hypothetical protein
MNKMQGLGKLLAASALLVWPLGVAAQSCDMRLSELETAIVAMEDRLDGIEGVVVDQYQRFARLESRAAQDPTSCPDTLPDSRAEAVAIPASDAAAQSDRLLACAQSFVVRVAADIDRAMAATDSQLVVRLGAIQQRILTAMQTSTDLAAEATFLALRQERLLAEHDAVSGRCEMLGEFYD